MGNNTSTSNYGTTSSIQPAVSKKRIGQRSDTLGRIVKRVTRTRPSSSPATIGATVTKTPAPSTPPCATPLTPEVTLINTDEHVEQATYAHFAPVPPNPPLTPVPTTASDRLPNESVLSSGVASSLFSRIEPATLSSITTITNQSSISQCSLFHQDWCQAVDSMSNNGDPGCPKELLERLSHFPSETYTLLDTYFTSGSYTDRQARADIFNTVFIWSSKTRCTAARTWIARCLIKGWGIQADVTRGFTQLKSLAQKGYWEAYCPLAMYYLCGLPGKIKDQTPTADLHAAFSWFKAAGELEPFTMPPAAKDTVALAQFRVGVMLFKGQGVTEDGQQAMRWFLKSADNGNVHAQYIVGLDFEMRRDLTEAMTYFQKSAEQGYTDAQAELGILLVNEQKYNQGITWLNKAVQWDHPRALLALGVLHETGQGVEKNNSLALHYYQAAADLHDPSAQYLMGLFYHLGSLDLPQDSKKAAIYFQKSANSKFAPAQRLLGLMYAQGALPASENGKKRNEEQALSCFRRAAFQGDVRALGLVGYCYESGYGTKANLSAALQYYRKAASIPSPFQGTAQLTMARLLYHMGRHRDAFQWFERAASTSTSALSTVDHQSNRRMARLMVARYRLHGWGGIRRDPVRAFKLILQLTREGVDQGQAHYWLAACLEEGIPGTCDRDVSRSFDNYLIAAKAGDMDAEFQVALMLANAQGVAKDQGAAFGWYKKAANKGHRMALYSLGLYYAKGIQGTPIDLDQARACFEKAARLGLLSAMTSLAILHSRSTTTEKGYATVLYWYRKAADRGDAVAQRDLGMIYETGRLGIRQDLILAFKYLQKAARQGDTQAQLQLGRYYQHGLVVNKEPARALELYLQAARLGEPRAPYAAAQVYYTLDQFEEAYAQCQIAANDPRLERSSIGKAAKLMAARLILTHASLSPPSDTPHPCKIDAFQMLHRLAVHDHFDPSFYLLGSCYLHGEGVTLDVNHAHFWLKRAADEAKDREAMLKVAQMYQEGIGVEADVNMAIQYIQKDADVGDSEGQYRMGLVYLHGQGDIPANRTEAVRWLERSAGQNHRESLYTLGQLAFDSGDEDQATTWWQKAGDLGCVLAMRSLATMLLHSKHQAEEEEEERKLTYALELLVNATRAGDTESLVLLGQIHQAGTVTAGSLEFEDEEEVEMWLQKQQDEQDLAIRCFEKAATMGHVGAMVLSAHEWHSQEQYAAALEYYELAIKHGHLASRVMRARYRLEGLGGLTMDCETAYRELLDCAQKDKSLDAFITLGQCCELGLGTERDDRRAYEWYLRAADEAHDAEAMFLIGQMHAQNRVVMSYESGKDVEALGWYRLSVNAQPHADASYYIGLYYHQGIRGILKPNVAMAVDHFRQAAEQDHSEAMFELGQILIQGERTVEEQLQGFNWLERAAQREHAVAQRELGKHYHFGKEVIQEDELTTIMAQDFEKAYELFSRAARLDDLGAVLSLGWYYEHGIHVAPCTEQAEARYRDAIRLGALPQNTADRWLAHLSLARLLYQDAARHEEANTLLKTAHSLAPEEAKSSCIRPSDDGKVDEECEVLQGSTLQQP